MGDRLTFLHPRSKWDNAIVLIDCDRVSYSLQLMILCHVGEDHTQDEWEIALELVEYNYMDSGDSLVNVISDLDDPTPHPMPQEDIELYE